MAYVVLPTISDGDLIATDWGNDVKGNFEDHESRINALGGGTVIYITTSYTITDGDGVTRVLVDSSIADVTITLPGLSTNDGREIEVVHVVGGNNCIVSRGGSDEITEDQLVTIDMPKSQDRLKIYGDDTNTGYWQVLEERISCQLRLDTYSGYGSTDTAIMRFANERENYGNLFTENHSTGYNGNTEGLEITIERSGKYSFSFSTTSSGGGGQNLGFSLNSSQLTTGIQSINVQDRIGLERSAAGSLPSSLSWSGYLSKGDIIRPHTEGLAPAPSSTHFVASYTGN